MFLASCPHGHVAVLRVLKLLEGKELGRLALQLSFEASSLPTSMYGKEVMQELAALNLGEDLVYAHACREGA